MNLRHYLLILIALGVGFLAGRKTAPSAETSSAGVSADGDHRAERSRAATLSSHEDGGMQARPNRPRPREDKKPAGNGPEVALPLELLTKDLRERQLSHMNFSHIAANIDGPLKLLGANESERERVKAVLYQTREDVHLAEKQHLRILRSDTTGVELDTTGMKAALPAIMAKAQEGIRGALPSRMAEALNSSISWDKLYDISEKFEPLKLEINKRPDGTLIAQEWFAGGGMGMHWDKESVPMVGGLIQADQVFGDRWKPFLKGVMLEPVEPNR